jgi:hypothetical protein
MDSQQKERETYIEHKQVIDGLVQAGLLQVSYTSGSCLQEDGELFCYVNWSIGGQGFDGAAGISDNRYEAVHDVYFALLYAGYITELEW